MWVCAVGDGGGVKLNPASPGYWIVADVILPWMIILPVGKTRGCCATSWHSILPSFLCHLLPSVILCPRSSFSFQLHSFCPSRPLWDLRCALSPQRDSVQSDGEGWMESERAHRLSVTYWAPCGAARACLCLYQNRRRSGKTTGETLCCIGPSALISLLNNQNGCVSMALE